MRDVIVSNTLSIMLAVLFASPALAQTKEPGQGMYIMMPFGDSQILNWSWGASADISEILSSTSRGSAKLDLQQLNISRYTDSHSPKYLRHAASGKIIGDIYLYDGLLTVRVSDAIIGSYSISSSSTIDSPPVESLSIGFKKIEYMIEKQSYCYDRSIAAACK